MLLGAGVPSWAIELTARGSEASVPIQEDQERRRGDFPRNPTLQRASLQLALEAARPANLVQTLAALDADVLAATTASSNASRVKLYESICRIAEVEAWPVSQRTARIFAGCLKQGRYRSIKVYFSAVLGHQLRTLGVAAPPEVQRCIVDSTRSALRGAGPAKLKEHFHVPVLRKLLQHEAGQDGFRPSDPSLWADVLLICSWWMFREVEASAAQVSHVAMNTVSQEVTIMLPVQKTDSRGMLSCRTLRCACRAAVQALCPFHAMKRHLMWLSNCGREAVSSRAPLFPGEDGHVISKDSFVKLVRSTLQACDVETTKEYEGQLLQRLTGHIARVSGAQWLHNLGVPLQMLQVLGRWSSLTILRYLQSAPLQVLPEVAAAALQEGQHPRPRAAPWLMVSDPVSSQETVVLEDSDDPSASGGVVPGQARAEAAASTGHPSATDVSAGDLLDFGAPRREADDSTAVEALTLEVATMKAALEDLQGRDSYIQGRSRKHHRIGVPEAANMPSTWATVCGWRYGLSRFYRASWVGSSANRCQRCFPECFDRTEGSDAATDDSAASCSGSEESSSSSSDSS